MLTNSSSTLAVAMRDITSETALWLSTVLLKYCLNTLLATIATVTNILNAIVFCRMGFASGLNQNFLLLSVMDFLYSVVQVSICGGIIVNALGLWKSPLSPSSFYKLGLSVSSLPQFASVITTTMIAVVRCYSVVLPLKVKIILSPRRQITAILLVFCVYFGFALNVFFCLELTWTYKEETNSSQLTLTTCSEFSRRQQLYDICRSLLLYTAFTTVAVCLLALLVALWHSSRFKTSVSNKRDIQVMRTVTLVSAIFVLCNLPAMVIPIIRQLWPAFKLRGYLTRSFQLWLMVIETNTLINTFANIFIFYFSSTLYRKTFQETFCKMA